MKRLMVILSTVIIALAAWQFIRLAAFNVEPSALPTIESFHVVSEATQQNSPSAPFVEFPLNEARPVALRIDEALRDRLTERELHDQLLDWLLLTAVSDSGLSLDEINRSVFDIVPVRYEFVRPFSNPEYGMSRSAFVGDGTIIALLPTGQAELQLALLAEVADRHRKNTGEIPRTVQVFEYELDFEKFTATLIRRAPIDGLVLFSDAYGYREAHIASLDDLERFLDEIDDLTDARIVDQDLVVGGRTISGQAYLGVQPEDVAAIWQAHVEILGSLRDFDARWDPRIAAFEHEWGQKTYRTSLERVGLEQAYDAAAVELMTEMQTEQQDLGLVNGTGFSLDPFYDYQGLLAEFSQEIRPELDELARSPESPIEIADIEAVEQGLAGEDIVPFLILAQELSTSSRISVRFIGDYLSSDVDNKYQYQAARYDGNLQGTEVGMTLFYTDLLAKLWALDYHENAPRDIVGFTPMTADRLPPIFKQEMIELPSTRLWFGQRAAGYQLAEEGNRLLFERVATRVFAASSNPLDPGREVEPNSHSAHFLGWWNDHYDEVARHEPQYQRLNEIMKWSLLVGWLGDANREDLLNFLGGVDVDRTNWFPDWASAQPDLHYQAWDETMFLPAGYLGGETEALPRLRSESYSLFSSDETNVHYLSGGVSLANRGLFNELAPLSSQIDDILLRSTIDYSDDLLRGTLRTLDNIEYTFTNLGDDLLSVTTKIGREGAKLRSADSELAKQPLQRLIRDTRAGMDFETRIAEGELGTLGIAKRGNGFSVGWASRDIDTGQHLALGMSKGPSARSALLKSPDVKTIIQAPDDSFLVQMKGSNSWIRMAEETVNTTDLPPDWLARVADPQEGVRGILMAWGDDAASPLRSWGYLARGKVDDGIWRLVGDELPDGLRTVHVESGGMVVKARVNPEAGEFFWSWDDLPTAIQEDPGLLNKLFNSAEGERIQSLLVNNADDVIVVKPASQVLEQISLADDVSTGNFGAIARQAAVDPKVFKAGLDDYLSAGLKQADDLLALENPADALKQLDKLSDLYGTLPDLEFRKGLAHLAQGNADEAALTIERGGTQSIRNQLTFLDEVNSRLKTPGLGQVERENVYTLAKAADWNNLHGTQFVPDGKLSVVVEGDRLNLHYLLGQDIKGETAPLNAIRDAPLLYVQDSPALNNLDWNVSLDNSLREVVSGDFGRVVYLSRQDIVHFKPTRIYSPDQKAFNLVTDAGGQTATSYVPFPAGFLPGGGGDDDDDETGQQIAYVVLAN